MGQKSRSKKNRPQQSQAKNQPKQQVSSNHSVAAQNQSSLIKSSATYQPSKMAPQSEDTMQVRIGDMQRIVWLLVIMAVLLITLGIINAHSQVLHHAGVRLSSILRIGN